MIAGFSEFGQLLTLSDIAFRLFVVVFIGAVIGIDREIKNRPAGMRTHVLVGVGAAVIAIIEQQTIGCVIQLGASSLINVSAGRITSTVVSGVGFLGAGTIVMSDRGIPASYRHMHGFGSHTYSFWNDQGERYWVKFHFRTQQGIKNLTDADAAELIGADRESHQRDLYDAIERGEFPKWKMYIQVMPETDAEKVPYHPFDLTKVWPKGDYPLIEVGEFELNRIP